ncbi:hypothetical protein Desti_0644 [Desulfomonile tiedjei DSM 6799]|uniref:Uncharacterized protein n=1 Tax=Desulfomonile tiedjei (strain ATCC 49306 / DSM 6799 / DCB-1) TaxID=706587 RepID=I4C1C9_DESTA|nr:hypothetical protein Desti_0644 [Desulfomonile tiedjei DSM 6799]
MLSSQFKGLSSFVVALFAMGVGISCLVWRYYSVPRNALFCCYVKAVTEAPTRSSANL